MTEGSRRPLAPLLLASVVGLVTMDAFLIFDGRMSISRAHTLTVALLITISVKLMLDTSRRAAVAEIKAELAAMDARRCHCTEPTEPIRTVGVVVRSAIPTQPDLPPDNVLSFELGRQVERETRN